MMRISSLVFAAVCALASALALSSAPALAAAACPNEQVRAESDLNPETGVPFSMQLPECRAYEMVTPALKNGSPISSIVAPLGAGSVGMVAKVGSEGSTVLIQSKGIWPGGEQPGNNDLLVTGAKEGVQYKVTRGESGWEFKPEDPPGLREFESSLLPSVADMSANGIWAGAGLAPAEAGVTTKYPNFYLLEPSGALVEVGPSVPLSDRNLLLEGKLTSGPGEIRTVGGLTDLSRMLFNLSILRWPFDQTELNPGNQASQEISSLYEYVGTGHSGEGSDVPTLVGVDNTGTLISQCGTEAGGYEAGDERSDESGEPEARSISAAGSSVFFTARALESKCAGGTGPAVNEVFARVGEPGPEAKIGDAVTVNVAGTSECATAAFDSCNVTQAVKYQGASTDGSKVFFTSEQPGLVSGDTDSTNNLYECRLPGDSGAPPIRMTPVNPCPDLVRVSVPVSGAGAEVQSVAAISQDGSHVYFVARGVLSGENAEKHSPTPGLDNLYVWEAGRTAFIATLSSAALGLGEAQATPDGDSLVFTSSADLTPGDTSTVAQVFLYEAQRQALIWVSRGQGGVEDGNSTAHPASLISGQISEEHIQPAEGRRVISEDGSVVVFESSAALTAQVHGGTRNLYLWRGGSVYLISDGTPAGSDGHGAGLIGIDASGQNVFFTTEAPLVGQDSDELADVYDARVDGGFPAPKVDECSGEACQGALSAPLALVTPGSMSPRGQGNVSPPAQKSTPPAKPSLTRSEKLAKALRACKQDKAKRKRAKCEAVARKRYRAKAKRKHGKSVGRGAK